MSNSIDFNDVSVAFKYKSNSELKKTYFVYRLIQKPFMVKMLTKIAFWIIKYKLPFTFILKTTMFEIFCAGQDLNETKNTIKHLKKFNVNTVLDYVAEGDKSEIGFNKNLETIIKNIECVTTDSPNAFIGVKLSGLEDVDYLKTLNDVPFIITDEKNERMQKFLKRVNDICICAVKNNVKVYFDAEEYNTQNAFKR